MNRLRDSGQERATTGSEIAAATQKKAHSGLNLAVAYVAANGIENRRSVLPSLSCAVSQRAFFRGLPKSRTARGF